MRVGCQSETLCGLELAGCYVIVQEHGSGASRARPALSRLMGEIGGDDVVVVVVRLDRLARSVSHFLRVEQLSDRDPIDTSTPRVLVAGSRRVAQLERALISAGPRLTSPPRVGAPA